MLSAHASWPLLVFGPGRAQFFEADRVLDYSGSVGVPARAGLLEQCDASLTSFSSGTASADRLYWRPAERELCDFFLACRHRARLAGGLRIASREVAVPPVEALSIGGEWAGAFPILRMHAQDAGLAGASPANADAAVPADGPEARRPLRKLVWFNPAGEPELPAARREAETVFEIMQRFPGPARFVARALSDHEWYELYDSHDLVFYYGHGLSVAGHPAIHTRNGRAPFFAPAESVAAPERCLVYAACLSGGEQSFFRNQRGAVVYPACRLADRPSEYLADFCRSLLDDGDAPAAMHAAARADAERGDIRRFLFLLQGAGTFAGSAK